MEVSDSRGGSLRTKEGRQLIKLFSLLISIWLIDENFQQGLQIKGVYLSVIYILVLVHKSSQIRSNAKLSTTEPSKQTVSLWT
jgi:hypothetical protein